ncbi:UbiA prenyltransferase family-domain-containing protein [Rhodocollybia butyracea]|uniref:UbiA prenyltransferase family-domain-containing protein n=1 Tax=Rhodocollybia butyracea TaxID=206335 RepID=A0A9P5PRY4_9AGAR|nr:UbiA prenyltransferase family-domain-containing protein [Rhodocollybia butyracea]
MSLLIKTPFDALIYEFHIFLGFSWRDWSTTLIPGSIFSIGAMRTLPHSSRIFQKYLFLILWLTLFVYWFTLSNQITGVEEDRINKPDRPIPSQKVTVIGAKMRWALVLIAFISTAVIYEPTLLPEVICWVLTTALLCVTPFGKHWFVKNCVAMTTGTWALLGGSWKAIVPLTPHAENLVLTVSVWTGLLMPLQDLWDMEGDAAIGRKTLPLVVGSTACRQIVTFFLIPVSLLILWGGGIISNAPVPLIAVHTFLGYRIMHDNGSYYDHKTYMVFTYIFCLVLAFTALEGLEWSSMIDYIKQHSLGCYKSKSPSP